MISVGMGKKKVHPFSTAPRRKDNSNDLGKAAVAVYESRKGERLLTNNLEFIFSLKEKIFRTDANLPRSRHSSKFTPGSDSAMLRKIGKNPASFSTDYRPQLEVRLLQDNKKD